MSVNVGPWVPVWHNGTTNKNFANMWGFSFEKLSLPAKMLVFIMQSYFSDVSIEWNTDHAKTVLRIVFGKMGSKYKGYWVMSLFKGIHNLFAFTPYFNQHKYLQGYFCYADSFEDVIDAITKTIKRSEK